MKHLLNNLSEDEKKSIRNKHLGGMKVTTNKFHKLITEKSGNIKPLLSEQNDFLDESYVRPLIDKGFKEVTEINLPDGEYVKNGSGYQINIMSSDNKFTGYSLVVNRGIRGEWSGPITVTGKNTDESTYKIMFKESGYVPSTGTTESVQKVTTNIATEGIKNVTSEMIQEPPFKGYYIAYTFGGTFKGVNYEWVCNGVEGMSGVRGNVVGVVISETVENLSQSVNLSLEDAKPSSISLGFSYNNNNTGFILYTTNDGKTKCKYFNL